MSTASANKSRKHWHAEDIKAAIRKTGITMSDLERKNKLAGSTVRVALIRPQLTGEKVISEYLNIPLHTLWPERWTAEGTRIHPRYAHKYSTKLAEMS